MDHRLQGGGCSPVWLLVLVVIIGLIELAAR